MPSLAGSTQARVPFVSQAAFWGSRMRSPSASLMASASFCGLKATVALPSSLRTITAACNVAVERAPTRLPSALRATGAEASDSAEAAAARASAVEMAGFVAVEVNLILRSPASAAWAAASRIARVEIDWPSRAGEIVVLPWEIRTVADRAGSAISRRLAGIRG